MAAVGEAAHRIVVSVRNGFLFIAAKPIGRVFCAMRDRRECPLLRPLLPSVLGKGAVRRGLDRWITI